MILFLAEATGAADVAQTTPGGSNGWITIIMLVLMLGVFYFFLYRPQKKQEKQINDMRSGLEVGDEITTVGGIIGKVISIKEETVMIETGGDKTKLRILRSAIKSIDVKASEIAVEEKEKNGK